MIQARGVGADDLGLFILRHSGEDFLQDLPGLRKGGLAVRVVGAPHHVVRPDHVSQTNADAVLLEAQDDVAAEEVAREHAVPRLREGRPPAFARAGS